MTIRIAPDERLGLLSLPPAGLISDPRIRASVEAYQEARAAEQAAHQEAFDAEQRLRPEAMEADAQALADAMLTGDDQDPGTPATDAIDVKIASLRRRAEASRIVTTRRFSELQAVVTEHGDDWTHDLEERFSEEAATWNSMLDALAVQYERMAELRSLLRFTDTGRFIPMPGLIPHVGRAPQIGTEAACATLRLVGNAPDKLGDQQAAA